MAVCALITLTGCERKIRAREREAIEAEAKARARRSEALRRAAEPLPVEPAVALLRVKGSGLPCAVDEVFANKCRRCHTIPPRHSAPLVFLTWDDTRRDRLGQPVYSAIGRAVRSGFMPSVLPLTEQEKRIILEWVDAGAPRADCNDGPP